MIWDGIVGVQAVEDIVLSERYKRVPDEAIKYVMGHYGEPATPVDLNIMERIMNLPKAKKFLNWKPQGRFKSIEGVRREIGPDLSDDELLLSSGVVKEIWAREGEMVAPEDVLMVVE